MQRTQQREPFNSPRLVRTRGTCPAFDHTRDKRDKFRRIAAMRMNNIVHDLRLLHPLANTDNYDVRPADGDRIKQVLQDEVDAIARAFAQPGKTAPPIVDFDE